MKCVATIPTKDIELYTIDCKDEKDPFVLRVGDRVYTVEDFTIDDAVSYELLSVDLDRDENEEYILVETIQDGNRQYDRLKILSYVDKEYVNIETDFGVQTVDVTTGKIFDKLYEKMILNTNNRNNKFFMGDAITFMADGDFYYCVDVLDAEKNSTKIGYLISKIRICDTPLQVWDLAEPSFIMDLSGKIMNEESKTIIGRIPEEDTELYSVTTQDGVSVIMLRIGKEEYQVDIKLDPKCQKVKFYCGDYDLDDKKEYALLQLYEQDAYEKDRLDILEIEEYVRVAELNLKDSEYYGKPFVEDKYLPGKGEIYLGNENQFLCSFELLDSVSREVIGYKIGKFEYSPSVLWDLEKEQSYCLDFYFWNSKIRDYPNPEEMELINEALKMKKEQYLIIQELTNNDGENISLFGIESNQGERMVLIGSDVAYPLNLSWKNYEDITVEIGDYDNDGKDECAIIRGRWRNNELFILEFEGKECEIIQCPKMDHESLKEMQKQIKENEHGLKSYNELSFDIEDNTIFYSFYVDEEEGYSGYSGFYKSRLRYHSDGTFEYVEDEEEAVIDLSLG